jgi:hypothetical protein
MKEYHKIQTIFLRDPETNHKGLLEGQWAKPEFEFLKDAEWIWSEKIDGTNIRIIWDGSTVRFGGKTDSASIPSFLLRVLQDTFTKEKLAAQFGAEENTCVCLYGEGFGAKIQKGGGNYISDGTNFILFDCKIDEWWLERESIEDIAEKLNIGIVPIVGRGSLVEAVEFARSGYKSVVAQNSDFAAEGLVMKPKTELFNRKGERVVSKIKYKDFGIQRKEI